jgi:hypothetical protein
LEIPIYRVPDFPRDDESEFVESVQRWLSGMTDDLFYCRVSVDNPDAIAAFVTGDVWHVIEGTSPRGGPHACVGLNGKIVHDPHPNASPSGLVKVDCFGFLVSRAKGGM